MKHVNFDRIVFGASRVTKKQPTALVFRNITGDVSVTKDVAMFDLLCKKTQGWRQIVGVYDSNATREMIEDDLSFLGYWPA